MIFILKNSNQQFLVNSASIKPSIEQPFKKINGKGNAFYHFKFEFNLNFFSLLKEYEIDPKRNITYISGHDYLAGDYATYPLNNIESGSSTLLCIYGSQSGLIYIAKLNQYRYTEISTKNMLSTSDASDKNQLQQYLQVNLFHKLAQYKEHLVLFAGIRNKFFQQTTSPLLPKNTTSVT
ncbi:hypothetical protein TTHERM_000364289 (macronuclear) [Tetrahymena thermophila SB210]|uniref:Uncharacterized protein n=1 Tax=Tetrahymena thermophila (strain SB210) TaxID=312017 RepID=W7XLM5_TETTS|nr:hypothetical protein TTHERM_000364289 [Tetrahymena thermophila SB210]EWS76549.1 hypothetical protein TTHERM_000364289 [Tetrahymena thermophila SB210]|eukprot:XP_012650921.1 hypothetical protein TTHERM_000364289 [Tetrahymena thermophila SB210]